MRFVQSKPFSARQVVPQALEALALAVEQGLHLPIVYNSGGYDSVETLLLLDGVVDIYMPDFKFWDAGVAARLARAGDYPEVARAAIREMHRQVGDLELDENGLAKRGLLVRHLVMPNRLAGTGRIADWLAKEISCDTYINLMAQYHPDGEVVRRPSTSRYTHIARPSLPASFATLSGRPTAPDCTVLTGGIRGESSFGLAIQFIARYQRSRTSPTPVGLQWELRQNNPSRKGPVNNPNNQRHENRSDKTVCQPSSATDDRESPDRSAPGRDKRGVEAPCVPIQGVDADVFVVHVVEIRGRISSSNMEKPGGVERPHFLQFQIALGIKEHAVVGTENLEDVLVLLDLDSLRVVLSFIVDFFDRPFAGKQIHIIRPEAGGGEQCGGNREVQQKSLHALRG